MSESSRMNRIADILEALSDHYRQGAEAVRSNDSQDLGKTIANIDRCQRMLEDLREADT